MGLASCPFDREGAATKTKAVIEDGVLETLLHNRKTAKKAGCRTTGNAAGAGRVAPTNLFFRPGKLTQEELLANLGDGLYLTEVSGLHAGANPISGDFSLLSRGFEDMKALARSTLKEAEKLYGAYDDMTVVTVRVEERA